MFTELSDDYPFTIYLVDCAINKFMHLFDDIGASQYIPTMVYALNVRKHKEDVKESLKDIRYSLALAKFKEG